MCAAVQDAQEEDDGLTPRPALSSRECGVEVEGKPTAAVFNEMCQVIEDIEAQNNQESPEVMEKCAEKTAQVLANNPGGETMLQLAHMKIDMANFPEQIFQFAPTLQRLYLSNNKLQSLPPAFNFFELTYLALNANQIGVLPDCVCALPKLKILNVNDNRLTALPDSFVELTTLTEVSLNGNKFEHLPPQLQYMTQLRDLMMSENNIMTVPPWINKLQSLEVLSLRFNPLGELPNDVRALPHLDHLSVSVGDLVVPHVYIGSYDTGANLAFLRNADITHIVIAGDVQPMYPKNFKYLCIDIVDDFGENLRGFLDASFDFIEEARLTGNCVVYCKSGVSCSGAVMIGYIMKHRSINFERAWALVRKARPTVVPHDAFVTQLKEYQVELDSSRKRAKK